MDINTNVADASQGLSQSEVDDRLLEYGANTLPSAKPPGIVRVFLRQFLSPLIYILLAAAVVSLAISDPSDAVFIGFVLLVNGIIGTIQEYSAGKAAAALRNLEQPQAVVIRDGSRQEIDARDLVPGDYVLLESGNRVPADIRLLEADGLQCDESLLTGESLPVTKSPYGDKAAGSPADHSAMLFASTLITRGRGRGTVIATGSRTEIGQIAAAVSERSISQPPLMIRLERFSRTIALSVGISIALLVVIGLLRGSGLHELFLMGVALAVSAIPEGLPVAISVALAIGMRRMAGTHVIIRNMPAIESLGSCTMIATDKTGTLTMNRLTVTDACLPDGTDITFETGHDLNKAGLQIANGAGDSEAAVARARRLLLAAALPNEAVLRHGPDGWTETGDTVDIALLAAARKGGIVHDELAQLYPEVAAIPYEPDLKYAASFREMGNGIHAFVKGAAETVIAMCDRMATEDGSAPIDVATLLAQKEDLAGRGLRVLAFAGGEVAPGPDGSYGQKQLSGLVFLGLVGMKDPIRPEVPDAIAACYKAGIDVAMITGDDPSTAAAIAAEAGMIFARDQVVTGDMVREAEQAGEPALDALTEHARIYARMKPDQKLAIVLSMARNDHFVAMTGDGVNDAPALKHAHVGIAMGLKGTDVAKESADIIITDDNFASIVGGIRDGRVAYANIRKVIFMLVSTGAAEVLLFLLAIPLGLPMPLLPVQLLWLNLVTNGIQDVALAAEKPEGDELMQPPRKPSEPIFDRVMIRRILHATLFMTIAGFATFYWLLSAGYSEAAARNLLLLLFVLFENVQTFNSRSERRSIFRLPFFSNPLLLIGIVAAQGLHILAMYVPVLENTLKIAPVSFAEWGLLGLLALGLLLVMEVEKWWDRHHRTTAAA